MTANQSPITFEPRGKGNMGTTRTEGGRKGPPTDGGGENQTDQRARPKGGKGKGKSKNPELFEACKRRGFCFAYNQDRCTLTAEECKYVHEKVPPEELSDPKKRTEATEVSETTQEIKSHHVRLPNAAQHRSRQKISHLVLIDSGADEVIRPYSERFWNNMHLMNGGGRTRKVVMHLAGKKTLQAKMSIYGEVMQGPPEEEEKKDEGRWTTVQYTDPYRVRWIAPEGRIAEDLGVTISRYPTGTELTGGILGDSIIRAQRIDKMDYLTWEDFEKVRLPLGESHIQRDRRERQSSYQ